METSAWAMSFARANSIYNLAVIGLVIGAVITIVSTITLIWVAQIKDGFANAASRRSPTRFWVRR